MGDRLTWRERDAAVVERCPSCLSDDPQRRLALASLMHPALQPCDHGWHDGTAEGVVRAKHRQNATIVALRAEVESLQRENADLRLGARKVQDDADRAVESLQAQLAAADKAGYDMGAGFGDLVNSLESDLAAVRTDLSVARRQLSEYEARDCQARLEEG